MAVLWVKRQCDLWPRRDKDHCGICLHPFVLDSSQTEQTGLASSTPGCRAGVERLNAELLKSDLFSRGGVCGPLLTPPLPTVVSTIVALEQPGPHPWNPRSGYLTWQKDLCNVMSLGTLRWYPGWNPRSGYLTWQKDLCNVMSLGTLRWYPGLSRWVHCSYWGHYKWKRQ